jgi:DNA primase
LFSPETIQQVIGATDIVAMIGGYAPLKRAGARYRALCPFHREKSPSFYVDAGRQRYHCFGCGKDGDAIRFVMEYENLDFPSAVRRLAERAGIAVVEEQGGAGQGEDRHSGEQRQRLLALHAEAADWFHRKLMKTRGAQVARDYLKTRGLTAEVARRWQIGYAPPEWDALLQWARGRGYTPEEILLSGLAKAKDEEAAAAPNAQTRMYDRFRDRLMFTICDDSGRPIAFSGRVLAADAKAAKYVNSPETPLFTKGKVLFGFHQSKRAVLEAGFAIVCEGQIDLITAFEAGVTNVIAPQGTAFTDKQAHLLGRHVEEVVLCFDADAAGQQAAERSFPVLLENNFTVRVATMPPGEDPDSLIRGKGVEAFTERIAAAQDFFDFQIERLSKVFDLNTPRGKSQFSRRIAESVGLMTDAVLRDAVVAKVTARLGIAPEAFRVLLKRAPRANRAESTPDLRGGEQTESDERAATAAASSFEPPPRAVAHLLCLALENAEARAWMQAQPWRDQLPAVPGGELLARTLAGDFQPEDTASVNVFLSTLDPVEEAYLSGLLMDKPFPQPMAVARDCWLGLEKASLQERIGALQSRMRLPELSPEETTQLQKELLDLKQRLNDIARL